MRKKEKSTFFVWDSKPKKLKKIRTLSRTLAAGKNHYQNFRAIL